MVRTAFVSTYPPRRCGIATFTHDLALAAGSREVVAIHPPEQQQLPYPAEVHHRIRRNEIADYVRIAKQLHECVDVVSIQHEFGVWGGDDGESAANVLNFVRALRVPAVTTLHSVPPAPSAEQRTVLTELVAHSATTVVMSTAAKQILCETYGVPAARVEIVPHGVPDLPLMDPAAIKAGLEVDGRTVLLSFGLMTPAKGYELAIDALPAVIAKHPGVLYVIVGATHPETLRIHGEAYRESLQARVEKLHLGKHVRFVDRFVGRVELTRWLEAADVFVTPYANLELVVSGTLAYAFGAGRAIVSTPYPYAREMLADGRGMVVPAGKPAALAAAINGLLGDDEARAAMGRAAYEFSRRMVWSDVANEYRAIFERAADGVADPSYKAALAAAHA